MRRSTFVPFVFLAAAACTNATGEIIGGDPLPAVASTTDCTAKGSDACSTWQFLYACYFGPLGQAGCSAQTGTCHAAEADTGGRFSGFVCGGTSDTCRQAMLKSTMPGFLPPLVAPGGVHNPKDTALYSALYKSGIVGSSSNNMPLASVDSQRPSSVFHADDLACIGGWITGGAKNN